MHRLKNRGARAYICRLPEPTLAHSREQHVQAPEAAKQSNIVKRVTSADTNDVEDPDDGTTDSGNNGTTEGGQNDDNGGGSADE